MLKNLIKSSALLAGVASTSVAFAAEPASVMAKNQSAHFNAVASQLELGGLSFSYNDQASKNALFTGALEMAVAYLDAHTEYKGVDAQKLSEVFTLEAVKASGSSASQRDGYVHYRSFSYMPDEQSMYAKAYLDDAPSEALKLAPAGADLVLEMHINGAYDPQAEEKMYAALGPLGAKLKELEAQQAEESPEMDQLVNLFEKIDSRFVFVGDISPKGFKGVEGIPVHGQLLISATNAEEIWKVVKPLLAQQGLEAVSVGNLEQILSPQEMAGWTPCLQYDKISKQLYISTTLEYIELCKKVGTGEAAGLDKDKEFAKLNEDLPESFSGMAYVSPAFASVALNLIDAFGMPQVENEEYVGPALRMLIDKLKASDVTNTGTLYVASKQDKGTLHVTNTPLNLPRMDSSAATAGVALVGVSTLFTGASYYRDSANKAACVINMSSITKATRALQNIEGHATGSKLTWEMLTGEGGPLNNYKPTCPSGGTYTLSPTFPAEGKPVVECSHEGHVLETR